MRAGALRHRVKLQSLGDGQDEAGQPIKVWVDDATIWADIRFLSGLEAIKANAPVSVAKCSIRIRHRSVKVEQRIVEGTTVYEIKAVLPDNTGKKYVDMACETSTSGV
ncbi:phage head closure protein [Collimonas fungivorans]|uniref:phage head closure protein n=1 Tax=Collimonas fungivorans TaxID=158899 RepID=UPI0005A2FECA|nr:phage head closure protein [Collimonas fungivorans]